MVKKIRIPNPATITRSRRTRVVDTPIRPLKPDSGILLWGAPGSGKSTYVSSLVFHREQETEPGKPDWYVMPQDLRAAEFVGDVVLSYRAGQAPPPTILIEPLHFRVTQVYRPKKIFGPYQTPARIGRDENITFMDPRGETFTSEGITGDQGKIVLDSLTSAKGLLLLIDPTSSKQSDYLRMFVINLVRMHEHMRSLGSTGQKKVVDGKLNIPVAICLTKMDRFPEQDGLLELLEDTVGESSLRFLTDALHEFQIFGFSALGRDVIDDGGVMRPPNGLAQPWKALTPLKWLIDRK